MVHIKEKLNIELLPAIPLLKIHPREVKMFSQKFVQKMFIAALFVISKKWK